MGGKEVSQSLLLANASLGAPESKSPSSTLLHSEVSSQRAGE